MTDQQAEIARDDGIGIEIDEWLTRDEGHMRNGLH